MALVKCPKCGNEVSDRCGTCPACGTPIVPASETKICPECSSKVETDAIQCRNCGYPFIGEAAVDPKAPKKKFSADIVIAALLLISFLMLLPEICYNRVVVNVSTQAILQVRGESFTYAAEGASVGIRNLVISSGIIGVLLQFNRKKLPLLTMAVSAVYLGSIIYATRLIEQIVEISADGKNGVVYSKTTFMYIVIGMALVALAYDLIMMIKKTNRNN